MMLPKKVFAHYKELEAMGLAAPQVTYIMHALKEKGLDVKVDVTTDRRSSRWHYESTGRRAEMIMRYNDWTILSG